MIPHITFVSREHLPPTSAASLQRQRMRILILGGTDYVGRVIAMEAISRDHMRTRNRALRAAPEGLIAVIETASPRTGADTQASTDMRKRVRGAGEALFNDDMPLYDVDRPSASASACQFNKRSREIGAYRAAAAGDNASIQALIVRPGVILSPSRTSAWPSLAKDGA